MKKIIASLLAVTVLSLCSAAARSGRITPSSKIITKTVSVGNFNEIDASMVNVVYNVGRATGKVSVSAPDNVMPYVTVVTDGDELECKIRSGVQFKGKPNVTVTVTAPAVRSFSAELSSAIKVNGAVSVSTLGVDAETSASIRFQNDVNVTGKAEIDAETSASVVFGNLKADRAEIDSETSASVKVESINTAFLSADAETSGSISVKGGKVTTGKYSADTSGSVRIEALTRNADCSADTAGSVKCDAESMTKSTDTGGSVRNLRD